ncbi:MAG: class I SAM-dependent methyltransferase [Methanomassiliicoccales archaeon]|nr:class I SAM-dependent methyltransferase [Methanomassiliicoccales archaeon]
MGRPGLKDQRLHWDETYKMEDFFGSKPSQFAEKSLEQFKLEGVEVLLELGCGQGRDTWLFARNGISVYAIDYSDAGICQMREKAKEKALDQFITLKVRDVRRGIPLPDNSIDAIYSHMFFSMEFREDEMYTIFQECLRVLRPGGVNIYSVRSENDPHYGKFDHLGEDMYQNPMGFVVHFFTVDKIDRLAEGYVVDSIEEFEDPDPPFTKMLYDVVLRKPMQ